MKTTHRMMGATNIAKLSGLAIAAVFGVTSEKTSTSTVMVAVATAFAMPVAPNMEMNTLVAIDVARMLTRLLPSRIAPINLSRSRISRFTRRALRSPSLSSLCMRAFDVAVSAVSEPEKKADINSRKNTAPIGSKRDESIFSIDIPPASTAGFLLQECF